MKQSAFHFAILLLLALFSVNLFAESVSSADTPPNPLHDSISIYEEQAKSLVAHKDYDKAYPLAQRSLEISRMLKDELGITKSQRLLADIKMGQGYYSEAAHIYQDLFAAHESKDLMKLAYYQKKLNVIYQTDKLMRERENGRVFLIIGIAVLVFLLLVIINYAWYVRSLKRKDRILLETIGRFRLSEQVELSYLSSLPKEKISNEERLYKQLNELMEKKQLFKNAYLKRDDLARELGTNRTYLAAAIRKCAGGITITEFISHYRLHYAASLLAHRQDLTINEIGDMAGFNSRSTYNRLFRNFYGMSPTKFREAAIAVDSENGHPSI
jgi:AraC-like DNA-binding protein